jgi:hypothetical protein
MTTKGGKEGSTRLAIVDKALADIQERLSEQPPGPRVRELRTKAQAFERAMRTWIVRPPTEEQRSALLKLVLELALETMALGKEEGKEE